MNNRTAMVNRFTLGLLAAIVGVLALAAGLWVMTQVEPMRTPYMSLEPLPSTEQGQTISAEQAVNRPLFWQGRRPVQIEVVEEQAPEPVKIEPIAGVQLVGVIVTGELKAALLRVDDVAQRVQVGDEVKGWAVTEVTGSTVHLRAGSERTELSIAREKPRSIFLEHAPRR